jgi:hypothetical protein
MPVTKGMFGEWKNHPCTQELHSELLADMEKRISSMINRERPDPDADQFVRAFVKIADAIISWQPEFMTEEQFKEIEDVED